jgi:hypothetical protein
MGLARIGIHDLGWIDRGSAEKFARVLVRRQQCLDGRTEFRPAGARLLQGGRMLGGKCEGDARRTKGRS